MAGGTIARRRKIFHHLNDDEKKAAEASGSANNADGGKGNGGANGNASDEANVPKNAPPPRKSSIHPSAARKSSTPPSRMSPPDVTTNGGSTHHLLPLPLVYVVLVCSGLFWISSFRDVMATGKPILDRLAFLWGQDDADYLFLVRFRNIIPLVMDIEIRGEWPPRVISPIPLAIICRAYPTTPSPTKPIHAHARTHARPAIHQIHRLVRRFPRLEVQTGRTVHHPRRDDRCQ